MLLLHAWSAGSGIMRDAALESRRRLLPSIEPVADRETVLRRDGPADIVCIIRSDAFNELEDVAGLCIHHGGLQWHPLRLLTAGRVTTDIEPSCCTGCVAVANAVHGS